MIRSFFMHCLWHELHSLRQLATYCMPPLYNAPNRAQSGVLAELTMYSPVVSAATCRKKATPKGGFLC